MSASSMYADLPLNPERNEIRLLDILPSEEQDGGPEDHVHCQLRCVDLDSKPDFSALSYAWGIEATRLDVYVNDALTPVTVNLESALRHLRRRDHVVTIWADALCINQADNVEKGYQVRRMHNVYTGARRTIAWLGHEADGSDLAMRVLRDIGTQAKDHGILNHDATQLFATAVRKLCERPYWSRLWVLQEYALAQEILIQCGNSVMDSDRFSAAYHLSLFLKLHLLETMVELDFCVPMQAGADYEVDTDEVGNPLSRAQHVLEHTKISRAGTVIRTRMRYNIWQQRPDMTPPKRLCVLLQKVILIGSEGGENSALSVWNPKDIVFGLLGLLGQNPEIGFAVDYGTSDEEIYTNTTRWLLARGELSLLSFGQIHLRASMPSWSIDWGRRRPGPNIDKGLFELSRTNKVHAEPIGAYIIRFKGVLLDSVVWFGGLWQPEAYDGGWCSAEAGRFLAEVETIMTVQNDVPPMLLSMSTERWQEGAWRIPIADQCRSGVGMRSRATLAVKAGWKTVKRGQPADSFQGYTTSCTNWYQMAMSRLHGRRLARTNQGLIGLMPVNAEPGDVVAIILGAEAPMLLRPERQGGVYKIVGESYIYGVMDGETITTDTVFTDIDIC
ncbi:hypothetical protein LTS10_008066 [Elasticomyces elasticus]|nr:hypothetical protein LTS10_008066 [Elasticomyces elasticus]